MFDPGTIGAVVGGGGNLLGGILANQANARQQNRSQDYMAEMSNTSHQREVADLRRAGLNPILSANKGASTPASSPAKMENVIAPAVTGAMDAVRLKRDIGLADSQIGLNQANGEAARASAITSATTAKQNEAITQKVLTEMPATAAEAKTRTGQAQFDLKMQAFDNYMRRVQNGVSTVGSAAQIVRPMKGLTTLNPHKEKTKWTSQSERDETSRQEQFQKANDLFKPKGN